uniref:Uncharacterized protein n=1 Tax=Enterococcus gallinarum TaxID=1353 RepID=A0A6G8F5M9_ENTGA|nr:hypothetical protein [Enterococcus gallinarum]
MSAPQLLKNIVQIRKSEQLVGKPATMVQQMNSVIEDFRE